MGKGGGLISVRNVTHVAKEEDFAGFTDLYEMNTTSEDLLTLADLSEQVGAVSRPTVGSEKELALRRAVLKDA